MKKDAQAFEQYASKCPHRVTTEVERRPANALCIESFTGSARCLLKLPDHWEEGTSALRWIGSGGSVLVFGLCSRPCANGMVWCPECGHRKEHHWDQGCVVKKTGESCLCNCQHYQLKV